MVHNAPSIDAFLKNGTSKIPVCINYVSKYSLLIRSLEAPIFAYGFDPFNLIIQNNGRSLELGPCGIVSEPSDDEYSGRLIFLADVYDMHSLFFEDKVVKLQGAFGDLQTVLARKDNIRQSFKDYTANLTYDLIVYKNLFDHLDSKYQEESEAIRKSTQTAVIKTEGQKFKRFLDEKLNELKHLVADFNREQHQCHGFYFRKQLWPFIQCCPLMARTNLKPRGYAGDSEILKMIYLNDYQGESTFAKLLHKHAVDTPAANSVRNRRKLIASILEKYQNHAVTPNHAKIRVLSLGCGPACELNDIFKTPQDCERLHFVLLDQDLLALSEAKEEVQKIVEKFDVSAGFDFIQESVRTMLLSRKLKHQWGQFDFIYSLGLFDYLAFPVAKALIKRLFNLLSPSGEIVIGNFHISNPSKLYMEYWGDWAIFHRTEEEMSDLVNGIPASTSSITFENTRSQMFVHLKKKRT